MVSISELFNPNLLTQPKIGAGDLTVAQVREEFKHIPLTDHEEAMGLLDTYQKKILAIEEKNRQDDRIRRRDLAKKMWKYDECYQYALECGRNIGKQRGFEFVLDCNNEKVFSLLSLYFSNDKRFEDEKYFDKNYSLQKGICLISPVRGNGKTTLLDCFSYNKRGCFIKKNVKQLVNDYERNGVEYVEKFMWLLPVSTSASTFFQAEVGVHYDDFGDEPEVMFMGNRRMLSAMIVNSIYDFHRDENMFYRFHVSMNYKWKEFEQKFGTNAASRMEEMFNLIPLPGESRRK